MGTLMHLNHLPAWGSRLRVKALNKEVRAPSGVPKVILTRLLFGLGGCALICASYPFVVTSIR